MKATRFPAAAALLLVCCVASGCKHEDSNESGAAPSAGQAEAPDGQQMTLAVTGMT